MRTFLASFAIASAVAAFAACGSSNADSSSGSPDAAADAHSNTIAEDASAGIDATDGGSSVPSQCTITADHATCPHQTTTITTRTVAYATPISAAPAAGYPVVVFFQGSFVAGDGAFDANASDTFNRYALTRTIAALLDRGYVVLAPDALTAGNTFWQTNIPPYAQAWTGCADDLFVKGILDALDKGTFGKVDTAHLYAMGISSGGFMTSRMAVSYPGKFRALVDHSGSYATCGSTCTVPTPLPADHPPTFFIRGDSDTVVPMSVVTPYVDALTNEGHEVKVVLGADAGHQWVDEAIDAVPAWFDSHK